ncbi:hypothetical protein BJY04DRAFT_198953 [Aspergillus karnatakaensis]|uniref:uncharacterized protein n=1 Tax=Aspergillus karnatakaensis TaxID=1810916 RepID=UPI003CCDE17E
MSETSERRLPLRLSTADSTGICFPTMRIPTFVFDRFWGFIFCFLFFSLFFFFLALNLGFGCQHPYSPFFLLC